MLNLTNKHTNKYHILISIFTIVFITSIILLPLLSTPKSQESLIKTPKEFTNLVNIDTSIPPSISSLIISSSSIVLSSSSITNSITETPKQEIKVVEEIKLETPKPPAPIPKVETQNNLELSIETPKPQITITTQPKVIEIVKPTIEVAIATKTIEQETPKPEPITEQPKVVTSSLFSATGCNVGLASQMLVLLNNHRANNNANPLTLSSQLNGVACAHSKWMTSTGIFSHTGRDGTSPFERCKNAGTYCYAENVAYNTIPNVQDLFEQFKTSPGHNLNMMDPNFLEVGLSFDGIYVTQIFR